MAYTKNSINDLLSRVVTAIDISDEMFGKAKTEYEALGAWINKESATYKVSIYPQGSFALGTVVKPISGNDDYDLDLVCELEDDYGLTARQLKCEVVKPWLKEFKRITGDIIEKRRCWHVEYDEVPNFHMDVIPSYFASGIPINITEHNEENDTYRYIGSNPSGYADWFYSRCQVRWDALFEQYSKDNNLGFDEAEIARLDRHKVKTPLQKAIQLLKRHRDVMFKDSPDDKPISIIITTLAAQLYNNEDSIVDSLSSFLNGAEKYINDHKKDGRYHIENPSFKGENFADKWNKHPERARSFFEWLHQAQKDFNIPDLQRLERVGMGNRIKKIAGVSTGTLIFAAQGFVEANAVQAKTLKVNTTTGELSKTGSLPVVPSHHHGKV